MKQNYDNFDIMQERKRSIYPVIIDCFEEYRCITVYIIIMYVFIQLFYLSFCRHIKHEIRQLKSLVPLRSDEGTCPACSQVSVYVLHGLLMKCYVRMCIIIIQNDEVYLSLDANFGLCRKKSAHFTVKAYSWTN